MLRRWCVVGDCWCSERLVCVVLLLLLWRVAAGNWVRSEVNSAQVVWLCSSQIVVVVAIHFSTGGGAAGGRWALLLPLRRDTRVVTAWQQCCFVKQHS